MSYLKNLLSTEKGKIKETSKGTYCHSIERVLGYIGSIQGVKSCPVQTIKVKITDPSVKFKAKELHLRIMYNGDVYCTEDPHLYGVLDTVEYLNNPDRLKIFWQKYKKTILANYIKISNNCYINQDCVQTPQQ